MGRIKELLEKKAKGEITDQEVKELEELQSEAKDAEEPEEPKEPETPEGEEEKEIADVTNKLVEAIEARDAKRDEKLDKVLKALGEKEVKAPVKTKFIVDPKLGKKSVDELAEIKVAIPGREDKRVKELSMKTLHFVGALMQGDVQKLQVLVEGTGARGGFLVPEEFANMIVEDIRDLSVMRQIADVITTTTDTLHLPNLSRRPKATFRTETAVKSTSTVDFGENVFTPYSLAAIVSLANELVSDASLGVNGSIVNYVAQVIEQSLVEREEKAFWTGSGTNEPTGISTYTLRTVAAGAGASDATRADSLIKAYIRTPQGYRNRGVWVMNSTTMEKVHTLKDSQGNYLLSRLGDSPYPTIKGRPVYEQNDIAGGTAYFGDFSYYKIVDREGINVRVSDEATVAGYSGFERNLTHVRVEKRVDGELTLTEPLTAVTGLGTP